MKLRSFQYRLLHNALILNDKLVHWKLSETNLCSNCNKEKETVLHFFAKCDEATHFWKQIKKFTEEKFHQSFEISDKNILLSTVYPNKYSVANTISLIVKTYMYAQRCKNKSLNIKEMCTYIDRYEKYEEHNALQTGKLSLHTCKWGSLNPMKDIRFTEVDKPKDG